MTKNGFTKWFLRIVGGVASVLIAALILQVSSNTNRITANEVELRLQSQVLRETQELLRKEVEKNRTENREEHEKINGKVDQVLRLVRNGGSGSYVP